MPPSPSPPPDRFQREIEDVIRLAEKRLDRQSFGSRVRRSGRRVGGVVGGLGGRLPAVETMAGWGLALMLASWLLSLPLFRFIPDVGLLALYAQAIGIFLLALAIVVSLVRGRSGGGGGGSKVWRGERLSYSSPYGGGFLARLRRMFRR